MMDCIESEVLIIGCGIAGGTAALQLAEAGISVTLVTQAYEPAVSNTYYAQGGIIYKGTDDSTELLVQDIHRAGAGHCNPRAVQILAEQGPNLVKKILLDRVGVQFDKTANGNLSMAREGSHSLARILHATDATGKAIGNRLVHELQQHSNISFLTGHTAVDLLTPSHHSLSRLAVYDLPSCVGVYLLNRKSGQVIRALSQKTILATGGLGQIFLRTSNPQNARGDGLAMAYRAGARVINNEFIQFHPTTFFHRHAPHYLISEAVRGAGAQLVNADGKSFMHEYDSEWKDLAPRDVVARSIHQEMLRRDVPNVYLDLQSHISAQKIKKLFPNIYAYCKTYGIDITCELLPVVPAAHYACGGVWVNEWGQTTIKNLYAIGEIACTGVHGANRLASTSLLEGLVWGYRSAQHIQDTRTDQPAFKAEEIPSWHDSGKETPDPALISQDMSTIKHTMWNYVGLARSTKRLERALRELRNLENEIEQFYRSARLTDGLIGLRNAVRTAIITTAAAWENKESVGCHYRE